MIDGHAHMEFETRVPSGTLVVSPGALGKKLGNLSADCLRAAHGADFTLINAGSVRESVKKSAVTGKDVLAVFPFTSNVVSYRITGAELLELLEHGLAALPGEDGRFPQVSGMVVHIKADAPKASG